MARYFAETNANVVQRVIVAPDLDWCTTNLGGTWVETAAPSNDPDGDVGPPGRYPGPTWGHDPSDSDRFAPPWRAVPPGAPDEDAYQAGAKVFFNGEIVEATVNNTRTRPDQGGWRRPQNPGPATLQT